MDSSDSTDLEALTPTEDTRDRLLLEFGDLTAADILAVCHVSLVSPFPPLPWRNHIAAAVPKRSYAGIIGSSTRQAAPGVVSVTPLSTQEAQTNIFSSWRVSHLRAAPAARGLVNNGNQCFINCVLQPLNYCPPFVNMILHFSRLYAPTSLLASM